MIECWKPIVGWSLFEISDRGRVKKKGHRAVSGYRYQGKRVYWVKGKLLKIKDRRYVDLWQRGVGHKRYSVADLVLTAFVEPRPKKRPIARHLDDNFKNNVLTNLAWGTRRDNRLDAVKNGSQASGSSWAAKVSAKLKGRRRAPHAVAQIRKSRLKYFKLTAVDVRAIRAAPKFHGVGAQLSERFSVSRSVISAIRCGKMWVGHGS